MLRALDGLPRIVTRILQLRAELRAAIDSGELPHNYRLEVASRSCDYFLVQMFEETCRLWPPRNKRWQPGYGTESDTADVFVRVMGELAAELAAAGGVQPPASSSSA